MSSRWDTESTICAIATGTIGAKRGAIRISGSDTVDLLYRLGCFVRLDDQESYFSQLDQQKVSATRARRYRANILVDEELPRIPVAVWLWPTRRSYTGMPSAELHTFGNIPLLATLLRRLTELGGRIAEPGEFTLRAFLAGRIDLTQCEGVIGAIQAKGEKQFETALAQLAGGVSSPIREIKSSLLTLLADIEAGLDFVDEDIEFIGPDDIHQQLENARHRCELLRIQMQARDLHFDAPPVVLTGAPNAGKSSLLNALTGKPIAIVSSHEGTTRDYLRASIANDSGQRIDVVDTAGVESVRPKEFLTETKNGNRPENLPNRIQELSHEQRSTGQVILYCIPAFAESDLLKQELNSYYDLLSTHPETWLVLTKCDLTKSSSEEEQGARSCTSVVKTKRQFKTSSISGEGIQELNDALFKWDAGRANESASVVPMTSTRCLSAIETTLTAIDLAIQSNVANDNEITAAELRIALTFLGQVAGEVYTDDILDLLFSRFCIGK